MDSVWTILYLKPRHEKKAARYCERRGIRYYLPLRKMERRYQRKRVQLQLPVFPGYLFVSLTPFERAVMLETKYVLRVLRPERPYHLLRQLVQVRRALRVDPSLGAVHNPVRKGRRVRILAGPFQGVEGLVVRLQSKTRVFLHVEFMQQAMVIETPLDTLKLVESF